MSAPMKPWEQDRMTQGRILQSSAPLGPILQNPINNTRIRTGPPPLPPRPITSTFRHSSYNQNVFGSYGRPMSYSPYSNYNSFGGYGYGGMYRGMYDNDYGYGPESRFIQLAEESTRPTFQGIESLVRAFGSISMMLDSTFFAITSSFRAVLGVAENFGRIRTMFGQIWSSFAVFRFLNWLYKKLLNLLGFQITEDLGRAAWNQAVQEVKTDGQNPSNWPIFVFLGMIVSAPYLISKLLPPLIDKQDPKNWRSPGKPGRALHQFIASNPQELTIQPGDKIVIAPKSIQEEMELANSGWVYAVSDQGRGIVPINYIQILVRENRRENSNPPTASGNVVLSEEFAKVQTESSQPEPQINNNSND